MTLRWVEVGGPSTLTEGGAPIPAPIAGFALAPPSVLNLMKAEINRVVVLGSGDAVIPIPIEVPRRQYIDFHADLFPPVQTRQPAQDSAQWIAGGDAVVDLVEQDPQRKYTAVTRSSTTPTTAPAPSPTPTLVSTPLVSAPAPAAVEAKITPTLEKLAISPTQSPSVVPSKTVNPATPSVSRPAIVSTPVNPRPSAPATPSTPSNPSWSRKFLAGKTSLKPDYYDLHGLSTTMGADVQMIKVSRLQHWKERD